ncbi:WD40 repeat domain-containing protein [Herbidospora cretacea]|uniref:WD40 repeat domain-containing protein n=1 Tax=Herbidospora cretacea TaxID=28444 RepID=UPI00077426F3|nr:WD40 repeat domain-containing protein [Herbidospora cretacea]
MAYAIALIALLAAALVLGIGWIREHAGASSQRHEALAYRLAFHAADLRDTDFAAAKKLTIAAFKIRPDEQTRGRLIDTLLQGRSTPLPSAVTESVALSAAARSALIGDDTEAEVWDLTSWLDPEITEKTWALSSLEGDPDGQTAVRLSPDGRTAITGGGKSAAMVWDLGDPAKPVQSATLPGKKDASPGSLALSADGSRAAIGDSKGDLIVWDLSDMSRPRRVSVTKAHDSHIADLALSSDGRVAVTSALDGTVRSWDLGDSASPAKTADLSYPTNIQTAVAMSADGGTVLLGRQNRLEMWRLGTGSLPTPAAHIDAPMAYVDGLSLTSDGRTALVTGESSSGFLLDLSKPLGPVHLARLKGEGQEISSSVLSTDGAFALTAQSGGTTLWDLRDLTKIVADPEAVACPDGFGLGISKAEWLRYTGESDWSEFAGADWDTLPSCRIRVT